MNEGIYLKLREHLNRLPIGMPETKSGVEIEILKELFTPEQAALTLLLTAKTESADELSVRLKRNKDEFISTLDEMTNKGLIWWEEEKGVKKYSIMALYPGILEFKVFSMEKSLAEKVEKYLDTILTQEIVGSDTTHLFRIIPVHQKIAPQLCIHPYDKVVEIIEAADSIYLTECLCRHRKAAVGEACSAPKDVCMVFGNYGKMLADTGAAKLIPKKEAMVVLDRAENAGLIHNSLNVEKGNQFVCNCCGCCCAVLKGITKLNIPSSVVRSDFTLEVNLDHCTGCGDCVDRCHFDAISIQNDKSILDYDRCVGCGVCILACPNEARHLARKSSEESCPAFLSDEEAFLQLAKDRGRTPPMP